MILTVKFSIDKNVNYMYNMHTFTISGSYTKPFKEFVELCLNKEPENVSAINLCINLFIFVYLHIIKLMLKLLSFTLILNKIVSRAVLFCDLVSLDIATLYYKYELV